MLFRKLQKNLMNLKWKLVIELSKNSLNIYSLKKYFIKKKIILTFYTYILHTYLTIIIS